MGNVVVWKPAYPQIYSAQVLMELFIEAGVPAGVINLIYVDGPVAGDVIFKHRDFAGIHFTGSTKVFQTIWGEIGQNIHRYKSYPRIVGETGGKDFIVAHPSAHAKAVATAISRGAFEYQGQKCSAASRVYLPSNLADEILGYVKQDVESMKMGDVEDFTNFINAVITEASFDKLAKFIDEAKASPDAEIVVGGHYDKSKGYFVQPTVIRAKDPKYVTMCEELFGPVVTVYVYDADQFEADAGAGGFDLALRPHRRYFLAGPLRYRPDYQEIGECGRQLLHQRQADRRGGGAAAIWRGSRLGHE